MQGVYVMDCCNAIPYTPSSDVAVGQVVAVGSILGIAKRAISANTLGALDICGIWDVAKVNGSITAGAKLYWDADGDPQGGTAGTGALTTTASGNTYFGLAVAAAGATDTTVRAMLIQPAA